MPSINVRNYVMLIHSFVLKVNFAVLLQVRSRQDVFNALIYPKVKYGGAFS